MTDYDVLVVGGGHNGLVCAAYLARAGRRVLVLEQADRPGGCAATREFAPGYSVSSCAQWLNLLSPRIISELALERHGLRWAARDLASVCLSPDGHHLVLDRDGPSGSGLVEDDRVRYRGFKQQMLRYARILSGLFAARPPRLVEGSPGDRLELLKLAWGLKRLGAEDMREFLRIIMMNMHDLVSEHFDDPRLQSLLSLSAVIGTRSGPRSPGTVFGFLYQLTGEVAGYQGSAQLLGGMGSLGEALAASARAEGVTIRTGARVASIDTGAGRVTGVTLAHGEQLRSPVVVSNADPVTTFAGLVGYRNLETGVARRASQVRCRGVAAKLHLALSGTPEFTGLDSGRLGQRLLISPDLHYLERAFNPVKYDEYSQEPVLDISIASVNDPGLAPAGGQVLSAIVPFAPADPEGGWDVHRQPFIDCLVNCLESYAPGLRDLIVAAELLTPADLEREYGMTGGHWHHAELAMDQVMMMRPFPGASQYTAPVPGLFLCGAGSHPGGGLMGIAGANAAREVLRGGSER